MSHAYEVGNELLAIDYSAFLKCDITLQNKRLGRTRCRVMCILHKIPPTPRRIYKTQFRDNNIKHEYSKRNHML